MYANAAKPTIVEALFLNPVLQHLINQIEGRLTCFLRGREIRAPIQGNARACAVVHQCRKCVIKCRYKQDCHKCRYFHLYGLLSNAIVFFTLMYAAFATTMQYAQKIYRYTPKRGN